eukprot:TRINITY_DN17233_c0_g1_i1.p1 TRINITY_DN17233_c0_g1~~TRINITY_DN17233_c0_g1_i1.p1  ORF type:complete len:374 (+),score=83.92 TRINITY_DN17233_c0_g1_i1:47-1168(+)
MTSTESTDKPVYTDLLNSFQTLNLKESQNIFGQSPFPFTFSKPENKSNPFPPNIQSSSLTPPSSKNLNDAIKADILPSIQSMIEEVLMNQLPTIIENIQKNQAIQNNQKEILKEKEKEDDQFPCFSIGSAPKQSKSKRNYRKKQVTSESQSNSVPEQTSSPLPSRQEREKTKEELLLELKELKAQLRQKDVLNEELTHQMSLRDQKIRDKTEALEDARFRINQQTKMMNDFQMNLMTASKHLKEAREDLVHSNNTIKDLEYALGNSKMSQEELLEKNNKFKKENEALRKRNRQLEEFAKKESTFPTRPPSSSLDKKISLVRVEIIEIDRLATVELRRKGFKSLLKKWHPDRCADVDCQDVTKYLTQEYRLRFP